MSTQNGCLFCSRNLSLTRLSQSAADFWVLIYPVAIALGKLFRVPVLQGSTGSTKPSLLKDRLKVR